MTPIANAEDEGITLVLGGARSGKSQFAERFVASLPRPWVYIATAEAHDDEMAARIADHRARRETFWETVEVPHELPQAIAAAPKSAVVLVDCLTLWLSNIMHGPFDVDRSMDQLEEALHRRENATVLVSNEVGLGLVPETPLGRAFRDAQGRLNQRIAAAASRVVFVVAGQPLIVKGST
ncbi:MAG: bifunctional adenosylcobinamide kinase/adenosylcobinamide-phosphate guanylyltransferase [Methyloceanibacter sp.]|uniref:bifunctional adenosylcobinamide kinase/adenosylcobinamide-phosphate guanylyltransferase n=1 Tax=Methyloceanibacter sp. TaxID=1965321 RepID=UPI001E169BB5|nr:bifunctional adenosylcobinamide kinase/adenosylcobinamide-phosphate guanylyltransferase [Methyloceanibacter sp.]MCB1443979.1 bifunctional adenosylcobinamide kinase/adenosylcobinamide-phosphate guanylyltransferase [Methyloceanibacter sp.]